VAKRLLTDVTFMVSGDCCRAKEGGINGGPGRASGWWKNHGIRILMGFYGILVGFNGILWDFSGI
jgi:hypothetical protein